MPAPSALTFTPASLIAANTAWLALLDTGAGNASIAIRSAADVLLAEIPLTDPAGTVNGTTGQLTLTPASGEDAAPATGNAAYAEIRNPAGTPLVAMPCVEGSSAVADVCVLSRLAIESGDPVDVISITIG